MVSYSRSLVVLSVAAALAVPATLAAQTAIPRTGGSSSSGSSGGSSGGGGGSTSSGGGASEPSRVSLPSMPSFPTDARRPSGSSSSSREGSSRGGSVDRGDGPVGPGTSRGSSAVERGSSMVPTAGSSTPYLGSRPRGDRALTGAAMERPAGMGSGTPNYNLYFPIDPFSPWGRWYPWYYGGFGYGYLSFDPWRYGTSRYSMYRYGSWYNPYDPWCYGVGYWLCDPWGGAATSSYGGSGGGSSSKDEPDEAPTASIRLRVTPAHAKVYVNGALVGTVSDFSGLTGHLKVTLGQHLVEIKADGYETFVPQIDLVAGRTTTVRGALKKQ